MVVYDCLVQDAVQEKRDITVYGAPPAKIRECIKKVRPDIVGITVPFTAQYENAVMVSCLCREVLPGAVIVMGGPDPSVRYRSILESGDADYCVVGEGELSFRDFVAAFSEGKDPAGIPGVACIRDGNIVYMPSEFIADLDSLPLPARSHRSPPVSRQSPPL